MSFSTRSTELSSALMQPDIDLSEIPPLRGTANALRQDLSGALDGVASTIPIALCGVELIYVNFPAAYLSNDVFATLLALAALQWVSAAGARPMMFSARLFGATALNAMLGQFVKHLPAWGVE